MNKLDAIKNILHTWNKNELLLDSEDNFVNIELKGNIIIVGSSGKLKGLKYGNVVNKYDNIIRHNLAPTINYEDDVGNRTTLRIIRGPSLYRIFNNSKKNFYLLSDANINIICCRKSKLYIQKLKDIKKKSPTYFLNYKLQDQLYKIFHPSTGFYGFIIALILNDDISNIDLIGFMNLGFISGKCYFHYWEKLNGRQYKFINKDFGHELFTESEIIKKLINGEIIY